MSTVCYQCADTALKIDFQIREIICSVNCITEMLALPLHYFLVWVQFGFGVLV